MVDASQPGRPKSRSMLSHGSRRSIRSGGSGGKMDLTESPKDKKRLNTKADPSRAINEAQPSAVALEESSLDSIRAMTWKDPLGNVIADPDRSNPTRSRLERPLDTIRSFEAAIEGTYTSRRSTYAGSPASLMMSNGSSRRSSCFGINGNNGFVRPQTGAGYYQNGRSNQPRPQSIADDYEGRYGYPTRTMRPLSSAMLSTANSESMYPAHGHQPSYDTITTAAGSYGTDTRGNSTDPSSHNSSVDRFPNKAEDHPGERHQGIGYANGPYSPVSPQYNSEQHIWKGPNGRPQAPHGRNEYWDGNGNTRSQEQGAPLPRKEEQSPARRAPIQQAPVPIKLNTGSKIDPMPTSTKRQSWFKRRFSKVK